MFKYISVVIIYRVIERRALNADVLFSGLTLAVITKSMHVQGEKMELRATYLRARDPSLRASYNGMMDSVERRCSSFPRTVSSYLNSILYRVSLCCDYRAIWRCVLCTKNEPCNWLLTVIIVNSIVRHGR